VSLEPLDDELAALLDAEREAPLGDLDAPRIRVEAAVGARVAQGAVVSAKLAIWGGLGAAVLGATLGAVVTAVVLTPSVGTGPVDAGALAEVDAGRGRSDAGIRDAGGPNVDETDGGPLQGDDSVVRMRTIMEATRAPAQTEGSTLARERALVDRARAALRRDDAHEALVALMGHEREFPAGALAEERDRLSVEALVARGRMEQARARAALFRARHPGSVYRAEIEGLVR